MNSVLREVPIFDNKVDIRSRLDKKNETDPIPAHTRYISNLLSGGDLNRSGINVVAKPRLAFGNIHYNAVEQGQFTIELAGRVAPSNNEVRIYLGYDNGEFRRNTESSPNYGGHNKVYYGSNLLVQSGSPALSIKLYKKPDWKIETQFGLDPNSELIVTHYHATEGFPKWPPILTTSNNIPLPHDLNITDKTELFIIGPPFDYRKGKSTYHQTRSFIAYSPKTSLSEYKEIVRELPKGVRSSSWIEIEFDSTITGANSSIDIF
uniref:VP11 n=1 Tax=viral metagenome TaxID=1070528 RepID=A0A2V0RAK8_9ZZZZ